MNVQNRNQLIVLCGGEIPPGVESFVEEASAAHERLGGGEFSGEVLVLLWMQAVLQDEALRKDRIYFPNAKQEDWQKAKEGVPVLVDWAGLRRPGKFVQIDLESEDMLLISINDLKGEVEHVPVTRVYKMDEE